jgi:hypothetical protein
MGSGGKAILSWAGIKDNVGFWRFFSHQSPTSSSSTQLLADHQLCLLFYSIRFGLFVLGSYAVKSDTASTYLPAAH